MQDKIKYNHKLIIQSIEKVAKFKYFGTTVTNQNHINKEIKRKLNSRNACYRSVHDTYLVIYPKPKTNRD
jgi:hypothetical protein